MRKRKSGRGKRLQKVGRWAKGAFKTLKSANAFLRKHKIISRGSRMYGAAGLPYSSDVVKYGNQAGKMGYGKRRIGYRMQRRKQVYGMGLSPAGGMRGGFYRKR